jgi:hypothetical protein
MPDVPDSTIEAEADYDYTYSFNYDFGLIDDQPTAIATAVAATTATTTASGTGDATTTASAASTATTTVMTAATTATADVQTTASATATTAGKATATATSTTTAETTVPTAEGAETTPIEYRVTRDGTTVEDAVYDVDPLVDTANPFGDYAVVKIDDRGGEKFQHYERGTRVDIAISENSGVTFENEFTGYVVERRELDQQGADALEVECYTFDQFLRRNTVTNDQTGNTITAALQDIIETDTPVTWGAANVEVVDEQELTRGYQGEAVETVLRDLAFKSNNEEFGVNDSLEFFFRPRETAHIDRGIDNTQWFNYDIPELGKRAINEVEVWFDDGDRSVIVDDGTDKLDLQDNLGLPSPGTQRAELNRPLVTNLNDAEDIGRKYLKFRNATLSGTVTTFGLFDAEPGDTIDITIDPRGIDTEFVIAATEYRWGVDETILTIVEKRGDVDDILTELNDSVQRVEMEGANRDAPSNRITTTNARAIVTPSFDVDGNTPDADRFVNDGRRAARDGWRGAGLPDIDTIAVGSDGGGLSRSNTDLNNQTNSAAASESLPDATTVTYEASITQTGVEEVGLFTASGTLIARATFADPVDIDGTVSVSLSVSNDDSVSRGVLTTGGQTATRDVLADNSPTLPNAYAYGSDGTAVSESDTALGNELVDVSLEEILIQRADTQSEFESLVGSIDATTPLFVSGGTFGVLQSCFFHEGENWDTASTGFDDGSSDTDISNDDYAPLSRGPDADGPDFVEYDFVLDYEVPASDFEFYVRDAAGTSDGIPAVRWELQHANGNTYTLDEITNVGAGISQDFDWAALPYLGGPGAGDDYPDLEPGTYTLRCEVLDSGGVANKYFYYIDCVAPLDGSYSYTFDETTDANDALDGPELFPPSITRGFATATTQRNVTEANFDLTANDVSTNFLVELSNDDGATWESVANSETGSVTFDAANPGVDTRVTIGRGGSGATSTPTQGYIGQEISLWELLANPDAVVSDNIGETLTRAIVPPDTIDGETVRECGIKSDSTLLTRHELAEFEVLSGQRLASSETTEWTGDE